MLTTTIAIRKMAVLWLLLGINGFVFGQTVLIKDLVSNKPLENVTLTSKSPKLNAITNSDGEVDITLFINSDKIEIRSLGYKTEIKSYLEIQKNAFIIFLETSNLNLDEVVISGSRWQQSSGNVPSKIVSISPAEVALQNPQTAADLLGLSEKLYIQKSQQGGGSPMIRGFATNRLLYTVDGIRMNTAIFRSGNIQNVINLDPFAIEKTEVLFGPGSVIYGSDAIGGVMSFKTLTPQLSLEDKPLIKGKAVIRYSSANKERTGHFDINIGWKKWALATSLSSWDFDNLKQGSKGPVDYLKPYNVQRQDSLDIVITQQDPLLQIPTAYSQVNVMQKVRFTPNKKWDFQYAFHYSETSTYGRYDRHNRVRNGQPRYGEWNYGPQKWSMNNLNITQTSTNFLYNQLSVRIAQQTFEESRIDRSFNNNIRNINAEQVEAHSANLDFTKSTSANNTVFYGLEYVINNVKSSGVLTDVFKRESSIGPARYPNSTWKSMAAYLNDEFRITERLSIQTGIRYDQYVLKADFSNNLSFYPFPFTTANINNGSFTGSVGGVYSTANDWVVRANFGTGFRSPNVDDIGKVFDSEPGAVTVPNPTLAAEYAYNVDLGIAKVFSDVVKVDITGYYTILNNAMVRRDYQLNGQTSILYAGELSRVQAIQNAARAFVYGFQAGLEVRLPAGFSISSNLNYQVGEEELEDGTTSPLRHAAPLFGISRFNFKANKVNVQFYAEYQGELTFEELAQEEQGKDEIYAKDANGNNYSPAWYTLNLKTQYFLNSLFTLNAGIENLTDRRYRLYSSGISAPGRNVVLSFQYNF